MARRRLNKKVFAVIMGVLVISGTSIFGWMLFRGGHADARALETKGDEAFAKADYKQAYDFYSQAVGADNKNVGLLVKLGDACVKRTRESREFLEQAHANWRKAINEDPHYKPAMEKLILSEFEQIELIAPQAQTSSQQNEQLSALFNDIRVRADQILAIEPGNKQANSWRNLATARQWYMTKSVQRDELDRTLKALADIAKAEPANVDCIFWLARIKLEQGRERLNNNEKAAAAGFFGEAADVMNKAVAGTQAKNAELQYHAHLVFLELSRLDPKAEERKHEARAGECITAAAANVNDSVKSYDMITLRWSDWQVQQGKLEEAKKIRKKLYDEHPNNQNARIAWAKTLKDSPDKGDRVKAVEILSKEIPLPPDVVGAGALRHRELQAMTLYELINIHLEDHRIESDQAKKDKALSLAEQSLDRLKRLLNAPRIPFILYFDAQVLLEKGNSIEAVKVMEEAYRQFRPGAKDYNLMFKLAQTYAESTNQPGSARKLCEEIVNDNPTLWLRARAMLARLLIHENNAEDASKQIEIIRKQRPDYPELPALDIDLLMGFGANPTKAALIYPTMKESDPNDPGNEKKQLQLLALKYEVAVRAGKPEWQADMLNRMIQLDPKNVRLIGLLVQVYKEQGWSDRAVAAVDRALAANPDDPTLKLLKMEVSGVSQVELREQIRKQIEAQIKDPFQREMRLYELERTPGGNWDAGMAHLIEAEKLRPEDKNVQEVLFKEYLARRAFDKAKPHLDRLVKMNADVVGGRLFRHRFAKEQGDFVLAEKLGLELVEQYPEFALSWFALGQGQMGLGKWKEAISSFTEVLARQPNNYEANRSIVDSFYYDGQTEKAEAKLREMHTKLFPQDNVVRELYLNHLANFGKPDEAIPERKDQLARNPNDPWPYLALAATHFKNAQKLAKDGRPEESKKNIDAAFDTLSRGRDKFPDDTRFYAQVAEIHQYNGRFEQAEQVLKAYADAELAKPTNGKIRPAPWLALAEFYMRSSQVDKAVGAMNEALVRSNNDLDVRLRLVSVMVQAHQFADAVKTLDAVHDNPDPRIRRQRLEILIAQGSLPEAEREIRAEIAAAQKDNRDSPELHNLLASVLIDINKPGVNTIDEAIAELNRALAMDHTNEASRYLRALAYAKRPSSGLTTLQQNQQQAINELIDLDKTQRNQVQTRLLLAELYEKNGNRKLAIQRLEDTLKESPNSREVRLTLVRMYRSQRPPLFKDAMDKIAEAAIDPVLKTDPVWHREAANLFLDQRRVLDAIGEMQKALQLSPGNNDYRRQYVDMLIPSNQHVTALIETDRMLHDGIDNWWLRSQRGVATGRQVSSRMLEDARKDPQIASRVRDLQTQALAEFDKALSLVANDGDRTMIVLRSLGETVGYDAALVRLEPHLTNDPNNDWKILALGMKRAKGDFAGAIADGERMLADPANSPAQRDRRVPILRALADVYQNKTPPDYAKARQRYEELLGYTPDDLVSLNNLAYILAELITPPDPQAAKEWSKKAFDLTLASNSPEPSIQDTHGWVLTLCGKGDLLQGMLILRDVVEKKPELAEAHYHLAEAYHRMGRLPDAEKEYEATRRLLEEDEKLGAPVDAKLRERNATGLGNVRQTLKSKSAA